MRALYGLSYSGAIAPYVLKSVQRGGNVHYARPRTYRSLRHDRPGTRSGLSGLSFDLFGKTNESLASHLNQGIDNLNIEYRSFLITSDAISEASGRARAYLSSANADVKGKAEALTAKSIGLQKQFDSLKARVKEVGTKAGALKYLYANDPVLRTAGNSQLGWRSKEVINMRLAQLDEGTKNLNDLRSSLMSHEDDTAKLSKEIKALDDYAQGKGMAFSISSIGSSFSKYGDTAVKWAMILGGGYLLLPLLPGMLAKTARSFHGR